MNTKPTSHGSTTQLLAEGGIHFDFSTPQMLCRLLDALHVAGLWPAQVGDGHADVVYVTPAEQVVGRRAVQGC